MINERVAALLIEQVGHELSAHQRYFGISLYFERQSLSKWARRFHGQSIEEAQHATRIMRFLLDNEVPFELPALDPGTATYGCAAEAVRTALEAEIRMTGQFETLADVAQEAGDQRSLPFLQWFIDEQFENERTMRRLLDLMAGVTNLFEAEALLEGAE